MSLLGDRKLRLEDRYELEEGGLYLSGLQALVRIPIDQHRLDQRNGLATATLISTAASVAGLQIRSLDQLGLAQKGGAVISDIKLSFASFTGANNVIPGGCGWRRGRGRAASACPRSCGLLQYGAER